MYDCLGIGGMQILYASVQLKLQSHWVQTIINILTFPEKHKKPKNTKSETLKKTRVVYKKKKDLFELKKKKQFPTSHY